MTCFQSVTETAERRNAALLTRKMIFLIDIICVIHGTIEPGLKKRLSLAVDQILLLCYREQNDYSEFNQRSLKYSN